MPSKQPNCKYCGHKLMKRPGKVLKGTGYAHKKKEHWVDRPHPAVPILTASGDVPTTRTQKAGAA